MMEQIKILFEKYNFDYICINPKSLSYLDWDFIPEDMFMDIKHDPGYLGTITIGKNHVDVYYDRNIEPCDVIFKYNDIRKERKYKLNNLLKEEEE